MIKWLTFTKQVAKQSEIYKHQQMHNFPCTCLDQKPHNNVFNMQNISVKRNLSCILAEMEEENIANCFIVNSSALRSW